MNTVRVAVLAGAALASLSAVEARAALIAVTNPSFELPAQGDGGFTDATFAGQANLAITGWAANVAGAGAAGVQNWGANEFTNATGQGVPPGGDGPQGLYVNNYNNGGVSSVFQNVGALLPNTIYTLTVAIGQRLDRTNDSGTISLVNVPVTDNSSNAGTTLSSAAGVSSIKGSFQDFVTTFTTGSTVSGNLDINLSEINVGGIQAAFDNVRLDATTVPEPMSAALLLPLGALGLLARRRTASIT